MFSSPAESDASCQGWWWRISSAPSLRTSIHGIGLSSHRCLNSVSTARWTKNTPLGSISTFPMWSTWCRIFEWNYHYAPKAHILASWVIFDLQQGLAVFFTPKHWGAPPFDGSAVEGELWLHVSEVPCLSCVGAMAQFRKAQRWESCDTGGMCSHGCH